MSENTKGVAFPEVRALVFDTYGTVVDWRTTLIREGEQLGRERGLQVDWVGFADAWRAMEKPLQEKVRNGEIPWTNRDGLHRMAMEELLPRFGVMDLPEEDKQRLNLAWHRLEPWSDVIPGLTRLRRRFILSPLSNASFASLTNIAKNSGIPWDCILTGEMIRTFKPDPRAYLMAAEYLDIRPDQVMMVAAHVYDLKAAREAGLGTAFVPRPAEWGHGGKTEDPAGENFDVVAGDFVELAEKLGC